MKKILVLTLAAAIVFGLCAGCFGSADSGTPKPLGDADIYLYNEKGERSDENSAGLLDKELATYRGVKTGDPSSILAEKYDLSEFIVRGTEIDESVATAENIMGAAFKDVSGKVTVGDRRYSLSFTLQDEKIWMIFIYLYPED